MKRAGPYDRQTAIGAAMSLFWGKGYHATTLKDLEAALNMKPGSIYAAFNSKHSLYLLALERYFMMSRRRFRDQMARASSPLEGLVAHIRSYAAPSVDDAARQACMLSKTLFETRSTEPAIAEKSCAYIAEMRNEFAMVFARAKAVGELPQDADEQRLAQRFQANVAALRFEIHLGSTQAEIGALVDDMAEEIRRLRAAAH